MQLNVCCLNQILILSRTLLNRESNCMLTHELLINNQILKLAAASIGTKFTIPCYLHVKNVCIMTSGCIFKNGTPTQVLRKVHFFTKFDLCYPMRENVTMRKMHYCCRPSQRVTYTAGFSQRNSEAKENMYGSRDILHAI